MRIATGILSIVLTFLIGFQSCAVYVGGSLGDEKEMAGGGAVGMLIALLYLIAGSFSFKKPVVSKYIFIVCAIFGFLAGSSGFSDLYIWGGSSVILAIMSYSAQGKEETYVKEGTTAPESSFCISCGGEVPAGKNFCPSCGSEM